MVGREVAGEDADQWGRGHAACSLSSCYTQQPQDKSIPAPGSQAGVRPGHKGQLGGGGKGMPVPSSPEAQDFLGSQLPTMGTCRTLRLRPVDFSFFKQN